MEEGKSKYSNWIDELLEESRYDVLYDKVQTLVEDHSRWRYEDCLNLVSAHNLLSAQARRVLSSGLADKIAAGRAGRRTHTGTKYIDQIDMVCERVAKRLFRAKFAECRPWSGSMANQLAIYSMTKPGDLMAVMPLRAGAHFSYREGSFPSHRNLKLVDIPYSDDEYEILLEPLTELLTRSKPSVIVLGTSSMLFPYPVKEINEIAKDTRTRILYDGAHVLGLIAGGLFQDPLREGAAILTGSTQKTIPGPIGGLILTNDEELGEEIVSNADGVIDNYENNRVAAVAMALLEMLAFGHDYGQKLIENAQALARALADEGLDVLASSRGYTACHQFLIDAQEFGGADPAAALLEEANIICTRIKLPRDYDKPARNPNGLRFGVNDVTRLGMGRKEMKEIAFLIRSVLIDKKSPASVSREVKEFKKQFGEVRYSFHPGIRNT